jgi:hypothetical protein
VTARETIEDLRPGPRERTVCDADGNVRDVPEGWELLPPGDALLTRRVKADGPYWAVAEKVGRRVMSRGLWAPAARLAVLAERVEAERASPEHARKLAAGRARRGREEAEYVTEFTRHILAFLRFAPVYQALAATLAERVAAHATPVGSGTVARTERIPVSQRAEAAVIAWLRHQTTAYDHMTIARVKGERREVRRQLAERSRGLLERYRRGDPTAVNCPLAAALGAAPSSSPSSSPRPSPSPSPSPSPRTRTPRWPAAPHAKRPCVPASRAAEPLLVAGLRATE